MFSPRAVDSEGEIFFNRGNRSKETQRNTDTQQSRSRSATPTSPRPYEMTVEDRNRPRTRSTTPNPLNEPYPISRSRSATPIPHNGINPVDKSRSRSTLVTSDEQQVIERRTSTGADTSCVHAHSERNKNCEVRDILSAITLMLRDLNNEMQFLKKIQTHGDGDLRRSSSTRCDEGRTCPAQLADRTSYAPFQPRPRQMQHGAMSGYRRDECDEYDEYSEYPVNRHEIHGSHNNNSQRSMQRPDFADQLQQRDNRLRHFDQQCRPRPRDIGRLKISPFSGNEDWCVWIARFEAIARRFGLNDEDKLDQLLQRLEGKAAQFVFTQLSPTFLSNYDALVRELTSRFRVIRTARSFAAKFSRRSQRAGETAEEFAADLKMLYDKAHGFRDRTIRDEDLVRRFLDGLRDDEIQLIVEYNKEPETIDEAVFHVVNLIQTRNFRNQDRVHVDNVRTAREDSNVAWTCADIDTPPSPTREQTSRNDGYHGNEKVQHINDEEVKDEIIKQLLHRLESLERTDDQRTNHRRGARCYACEQRGHFARDCPNVPSNHDTDNGKPRGFSLRRTRIQDRDEAVIDVITDFTETGYPEPTPVYAIDTTEHLNESCPLLQSSINKQSVRRTTTGANDRRRACRCSMRGTSGSSMGVQRSMPMRMPPRCYATLADQREKIGRGRRRVSTIAAHKKQATRWSRGDGGGNLVHQADKDGVGESTHLRQLTPYEEFNPPSWTRTTQWTVPQYMYM